MDLQKANVLLAGRYSDLLLLMTDVASMCDKEMSRGEKGAELARRITQAIKGLPGKATG